MKPSAAWPLWRLALLACALLSLNAIPSRGADSVTVPIVLDHNRMLVEAEAQRADGTWRKALLWIDTGNPDCLMSESLARDLGTDLSAAQQTADGAPLPLAVAPPRVRIGGMPLDFSRVTTRVLFEPRWLFGTMHNDANLPSTVLRQFAVVFDYPRRQLTLARPGTLAPRGVRAAAAVHPTTGIVQIDAVIAGDSLSLALDNGASYSFISDDVFTRLVDRHPDWARCTGAIGCANIWGWWPGEPEWPVARVNEMSWGPVRLTGVGVVGLPGFFQRGTSLGGWYSQKSARPVEGFLGPNAFKAFRVEIDYANSAVYFEPGAEVDAHDMDLVGLTLQLASDGSYRVIGIIEVDGQPSVAGVEPEDCLLRIGDLEVTGATMGTVVDALRGKPGDTRLLLLERNGERIEVSAPVMRFL